MPTLVRILVQLGVAGPIIVYSPFALVLGPVTLFLALTGQTELAKGIAYGFGAFGLIGLYASILVTTAAMRRIAALRWIVVSCLALGIIAALTMAFMTSEDGTSVARRPELFEIWFLGGPIVVAIWNLVRIFRPAPVAVATA